MTSVSGSGKFNFELLRLKIAIARLKIIALTTHFEFKLLRIMSKQCDFLNGPEIFLVRLKSKRILTFDSFDIAISANDKTSNILILKKCGVVPAAFSAQKLRKNGRKIFVLRPHVSRSARPE